MSVQPVTSTRAASSLLPYAPGDLGLEQACVCVLAGGRSSEREVSLDSGRVMQAALSATDTQDGRGPARVRTVEILPDGRWRVGPQVLSPGAALDELSDVDVFFSALHGGEGEGGAIQGLFTCCDRAFTGSGVAASAASLDKVFGRQLLAAEGARVAPGQVLSRARWSAERTAVEHELAELQGAREGLVIKPRAGGSSVGCSIVRKPRELADAFATAFAWEEEALVEAFVTGVEATGGVLELPGRGPVALPVVEIRPHAGRFFDYHEKYAQGGALELCPPERLSPATCTRIQELSLLAHRTLRCSGYSRSDFIVPPATCSEASGPAAEPVFLELNTLPGMTPRSLLPRAAEAFGIDYRTLCLLIAAEAVARKR